MYATMAEVHQQSFISKLHSCLSSDMPHAEPLSRLKADESELVQGILQMSQGFCSYFFNWDESMQKFWVKNGIFVCHLSQTSLNSVLDKFIFCGTCLKRVELFVKKVKTSSQRAPTLKAFANSVHSWLKRLRDLALKVEIKLVSVDCQMTTTLLQLTDSLSSMCSGAEFLTQVVYGSIPNEYINSEIIIPANVLAVRILDYLFKKLGEVCFIQADEEDAYHMLLSIMGECLLPYLEVLDLWLYEGILDDPCEEVFFYANNAITIHQPTYWETSYLYRSIKSISSKSNVDLAGGGVEHTSRIRRESSDQESASLLCIAGGIFDHSNIDCPVFLKELARPIVSAGKSLQLIQHVQGDQNLLFNKRCGGELYDILKAEETYSQFSPAKTHTYEENCNYDFIIRDSNNFLFPINYARVMGILTLPEVFLVSLTGLVGDGDHIYHKLTMPFPEIAEICKPSINKERMQKEVTDEKRWVKFLAEAMEGKRKKDRSHFNNFLHPRKSIMTVSRQLLDNHKISWSNLNISQYIHLPPLNDENLRKAIYTENLSGTEAAEESPPRFLGTDYTFGFLHNKIEQIHAGEDIRTLDYLYSFPTLLPSFEEGVPVSDLLPFQKNSSLSSRILSWIQNISMRSTRHPDVIIKECIAVYIKKQMDQIGRHILLKFMTEWKLMDQLNIIRSIYLLGSGDLLQKFLAVIFDKMDKGESWDDDFELNTVLQESIRDSADSTLLGTPDALAVSILHSDTAEDNKVNKASNITTTRGRVRGLFLGIDALDVLKFSYKISWPLDLIVNAEALKKYNQVMGFLLKVKRAKYLLDKSRRWMWKGKLDMKNRMHHLLVEQKLLHFVDAFHQYVMDRVFHSSWIELCGAMSSAGSLDEVIQVHEAYLTSIQQQCFVSPDKLWALIASRVKSILGLALEFYSIQRSLHNNDGGAAPAIEARCEMEVDRIERHFDECIAFLLRVLSFKLNVGHFPHLADLVVRLNYNYFYMSDSGNLQKLPGFEAAKLGGRVLPSGFSAE